MSEDLSGATLEQLRTLCTVAAEQSFSAAARRLGKVQSAVSQSMERLERQLALRLFDRSAKAVRLTSAGQAVVAVALRVVAEADALTELTGALRAGAERKITIVIDSLFPTSALVSFAQEFESVHSCVELTLLTETLSAVTTRVREKQASFGVAGPAADFTGLERHSVGEVRLVPVCAKGHPLARVRGLLSDEAVRREVQVVLSERALETDRATADQAVLSARTWRVVDLATKHALLLGGLGWGNMPEHAVHEDLRRGRLVALRLAAWGRSEHVLSLSLVRRAGAVDGPVAKWARERLSSLCQTVLRSVATPRARRATA